MTEHARLRPEPWDDEVADAIALVEAVIEDDMLAAGVILRNADAGGTFVVLAKLLFELVSLNETGVCVGRCCFREWARLAVERQ